MKKLKIFLIVGVVLLLVAGSYILYLFKFKEYDIADEKVTEIVAEPYKVEMPDGSTILIDENGDVVEESITKKTTSVGNTSVSENSYKSTNSSSEKKSSAIAEASSDESSENSEDTTKDEPTVSSIKEKYRPTFEGIETQADAKLNALASRAFNEYKDSEASGKDADFAYFYNKYMTAVADLEASTDTVFQAIMQAVEKDLVINGYDKSYAQSFKEEYEARKKARRDSLLNKALENR
ncbi:hypothetical protein AM499_12130 [Bacillus sp. FJAT-22090]|uniref:hypothetical protein n=1 Tax=Bacillus sp. FJAT-22090 TaxID=1581038 RepID=UPI0006B05C92|nr:hypothetical protein [Bacillus sp. FJAT-22090]ALC86490.1 hypothetical protein AM499_12130 [Bacillus sp. FJAT-22090]